MAGEVPVSGHGERVTGGLQEAREGAGADVERDDDQEEVIRHRVEVYNSQTSPLVAFYADEGILVGIDATGPVEEVTSRGLAALEPYMR